MGSQFQSKNYGGQKAAHWQSLSEKEAKDFLLTMMHELKNLADHACCHATSRHIEAAIGQLYSETKQSMPWADRPLAGRNG